MDLGYSMGIWIFKIFPDDYNAQLSDWCSSLRGGEKRGDSEGRAVILKAGCTLQSSKELLKHLLPSLHSVPVF